MRRPPPNPPRGPPEQIHDNAPHALSATNKLFELAGTRSTRGVHNFDRHWRRAGALTLHDPRRRKYAILGHHALNGIDPRVHAWS